LSRNLELAVLIMIDFLPNTALSVFECRWIYIDAYGGKYEIEICLGRLASGAIRYCKDGNDIK